LSQTALALAHQFGAWSNTDVLTKYPVFAVVGKSDDGVNVRVGDTTKHAENPLWKQDKLWEPRIDNGSPNAIYGPFDPLGTWRMWYGASLWEYGHERRRDQVDKA
jgi:hypothetical protein